LNELTLHTTVSTQMEQIDTLGKRKYKQTAREFITFISEQPK